MPEPAHQLRLLGPVLLTGPDPAACDRVLAQPKRLALLAYLAARPPGEWVHRERVMAVFWPELPAARAQGNLRNGLYQLRRALGRSLISSRGAQVGVSPGLLDCDAATLLAAPSTGDRSGEAGDAGTLRGLLDLYRGEFLDGLHVSDAPDFERWVDRTRAALRARAADVAWALSVRAERDGEWITSARHARLATDLSVDVEGATQRLIRLLDRAGDRGAAIAEYDRLVTWLSAEFDIPPSPETVALAEEVRGRSAPVLSAGRVERSAVHVPGGSRSLAVLPFEDLSGGSAGYLANGMSEDLLTALTRIRGVRVVSRTSVRRFAAGPPDSLREVRDQLGVDLVVEGSVQFDGDRVRITVQLIDAERDEHLWAQSYDRLLTDVFEVQSDVALRIARALEAELSPREHARLRRPDTTSLEAWRLYLRGRELWRSRNPEAADRATVMFRRALDVDDRFAAAWVGVADACLVRAAVGPGSIDEAVRTAKEAIRCALDCDPDLGEARATRGLIHTFFECDHVAAGREYSRAVELSPGYATAHQWYGNWLCAYGRVTEGLAELAVAIDLDPLSPAMSDSLALALYHAGRIAEAESQCSQTLELDPAFWRAHITMALCRSAQGDLDGAAGHLTDLRAAGGYGIEPVEAREAARLPGDGARPALDRLLERVRSRARAVPAIRSLEIVILMLLGEHARALDALRVGHEEGSLGLAMMYAPVLDPLGADPQFRALMADAGLLLPRWRTGRDAERLA